MYSSDSMADWKLPPRIKIYEALGAVADGRVKPGGEREMLVTSSSGSRVYKVTWSEDRRAYGSDDNGSIFQGYLGYPILAAMMVLGELPYDPGEASKLAGVPWKELNERFKRDYDAVLAHIWQDVDEPESIDKAVDRILAVLGNMTLSRYSPRRKI